MYACMCSGSFCIRRIFASEMSAWLKRLRAAHDSEPQPACSKRARDVKISDRDADAQVPAHAAFADTWWKPCSLKQAKEIAAQDTPKKSMSATALRNGAVLNKLAKELVAAIDNPSLGDTAPMLIGTVSSGSKVFSHARDQQNRQAVERQCGFHVRVGRKEEGV